MRGALAKQIAGLVGWEKAQSAVPTVSLRIRQNVGTAREERAFAHPTSHHPHPAYALSNSAITSFRIPIIACMTRFALVRSGSLR